MPEPFPAAWPGPLAGGAARSRCRARRRGRSGSPAAPMARWRRRATPTAPTRSSTIPHRATTGTSGAALVGRRLAPQRPRPRPAPGRGPRRDLDERAARASRCRSSACPVAVLHLTASMPVATCVVRLSEVAPRRDLVARRDRRAEPHPPAVGHRPLADADARASRPRRSGSRCGPPATGSRPARGSGSPCSPRCGRSCGRRRSRASSASTTAPARRPGSSCPSSRTPRPTLEPPAFRTGAGRRCARSARPRRTRPSGGSRRT